MINVYIDACYRFKIKECLSDNLGLRIFEITQLADQTMINDEESDVIPKTKRKW